MNFEDKFIEWGIEAAKLEGLPFEDESLVFIRHKEIEEDSMLPDLVATVLVADPEDYQTIGVHRIPEEPRLQIVGASEEIDTIPLDELESLLRWLRG